MNPLYLDTARLFIQVAPLVFADGVFALKGGTAINLFMRDMLRLSVDRDLMVFNALRSNTDDHPRNHALIATTDKWELSPAYDLTPNPLTSPEKRDLAVTCGTFNRWRAQRCGCQLPSGCSRRRARTDPLSHLPRMR